MKLREVQRVLQDTFQKELTDGRKRHLVFWYDEKGEFLDDISTLELENVRIWSITKNNLFATKYELEKVDPDSHFLLYANMAKPPPNEDWLLDLYKVAYEFATDKTTVIMRDMGITDDSLRPVFERYAKFFNNQKRISAFQSFSVPSYTEEVIDVTILTVLTKSKLNTLDEVVRSLLSELARDEQTLWTEVEKYNADQSFWSLLEKHYGYSLPERTLQSFMLYLTITYLSERMPGIELPVTWKKYKSATSMNAIVFMNHFMNNSQDIEAFRSLADQIAPIIKINEYLAEWEISELLEADAFRQFDEKIISYLENQLISDAGQFDRYKEIISKRRLLHWYNVYQPEYEAIEQAVKLLDFTRYREMLLEQKSSYDWFQAYSSDFYKVDTTYRKFYVALDQVEDKSRLEMLREKVENFYSNGFTQELAAKWTGSLEKNSTQTWALSGLEQQNRFYRTFIQPYMNRGERVFVIISDGLRYEAAKELMNLLNNERKASTEITAIQSVMPSYTDLGMAALLPHKKIHYQKEGDHQKNVLVDGLICSSTSNRDQLLKRYVPDSLAITFKEMMNLNRTQLRETFAGKKLVYIYHNTIDAMGDHVATEGEVFDAVEDAMRDIRQLVNQLVNNVSASNILITADHGFLYRRDPLVESDKVPKKAEDVLLMKRRFILGNRPLDLEGTLSYSLDVVIDQDEPLYATIPKGTGRFAIQGAGANYVHGGAMLQEIVVPVITFKNDRSASSKNEIQKVNVKLTSPSRKITNTITYLEFFQTEKIEEKKQPLRMKMYFVDEAGQRISNECIIIADSQSSSPEVRTYREKFVFKTRTYDKRARYFLVMEDEEETVETIYEKIPFSIDIAFSNYFGF